MGEGLRDLTSILSPMWDSQAWVGARNPPFTLLSVVLTAWRSGKLGVRTILRVGLPLILPALSTPAEEREEEEAEESAEFFRFGSSLESLRPFSVGLEPAESDRLPSVEGLRAVEVPFTFFSTTGFFLSAGALNDPVRLGGAVALLLPLTPFTSFIREGDSSVFLPSFLPPFSVCPFLVTSKFSLPIAAGFLLPVSSGFIEEMSRGELSVGFLSSLLPCLALFSLSVPTPGFLLLVVAVLLLAGCLAGGGAACLGLELSLVKTSALRCCCWDWASDSS